MGTRTTESWVVFQVNQHEQTCTTQQQLQPRAFLGHLDTRDFWKKAPYILAPGLEWVMTLSPKAKGHLKSITWAHMLHWELRRKLLPQIPRICRRWLRNPHSELQVIRRRKAKIQGQQAQKVPGESLRTHDRVNGRRPSLLHLLGKYNLL